MTEPTDPTPQPLYGQVPEPPRPRGRSRLLTLTLVAVLAAAAGAGGVIALRGNTGAAAARPGTAPPSTAPPSAVSPGTAAPSSPGSSAGSRVTPAGPGASAIPVPPAGAPPTANGKLNAQGVANKVQPGMVNISAPAAYASQLSAGTGIILTASGLVLTNNHV